MHTQPFDRSAVYGPDTLKVLGGIFDDTWASIVDNFDPGSRDSARVRLATILLELAATDCAPLELKCRAIGAMQVRSAA